MSQTKASDEIFCRSCGEPIKKKAEICPECGVRNEAGTQASRETTTNTPSTGHDPSQYSTTVSETWWYGVAGGIVLWLLVFMLSSAMGSSLGAFAGLLVFVAWIGLPIAAYFDMQYIRANGNWNPNTVLWVIALSVWLVNIIAGAVYLYRRHEVIGKP